MQLKKVSAVKICLKPGSFQKPKSLAALLEKNKENAFEGVFSNVFMRSFFAYLPQQRGLRARHFGFPLE